MRNKNTPFNAKYHSKNSNSNKYAYSKSVASEKQLDELLAMLNSKCDLLGGYWKENRYLSFIDMCHAENVNYNASMSITTKAIVLSSAKKICYPNYDCYYLRFDVTRVPSKHRVMGVIGEFEGL